MRCSTGMRWTVFPPPGPIAAIRSSPDAKSRAKPARLYVGVAAQGRSLKVILLRGALALLSAAQKPYGPKAEEGPPIQPTRT